MNIGLLVSRIVVNDRQKFERMRLVDLAGVKRTERGVGGLAHKGVRGEPLANDEVSAT